MTLTLLITDLALVNVGLAVVAYAAWRLNRPGRKHTRNPR